MLSIVLGAVALAAVIVLAAHHARERRALVAEIRSMRRELQRAREALAAKRSETEARSSCEGSAPAADPVSQDELDDDARGSRTLH